jgi:hypothetical protein
MLNFHLSFAQEKYIFLPVFVSEFQPWVLGTKDSKSLKNHGLKKKKKLKDKKHILYSPKILFPGIIRNNDRISASLYPNCNIRYA